MAKKRVHEIAKAQGVSSKELLGVLNAAGVKAKAAASSVEESEALKAIGAAKENGDSATKVSPSPAPPAKRQSASISSKKPAESVGGQSGSSSAPGGAGAPKKRRVVIDSQAARRDQMGGPPPQRPPRRRGGRRRRPLLEEPPTEIRYPDRAGGNQSQLGRDGPRGRRVTWPCSGRSDQEADDDGRDGDPDPNPHR